MDDEVRHNVWDHPSVDPTPIQYTDLSNLLDFSGFDPEMFLTNEVSVLNPQLEALGYKVHHWSDEPHNYLAHATGRVCKCTDRSGGIRWFRYE